MDGTNKIYYNAIISFVAKHTMEANMKGLNLFLKRTLAICLIAVLTVTLLPNLSIKASAAEETVLSNFAVSNVSPGLKDDVTFSFDITAPAGKEIADVQYSVFYGKYGTVGCGTQNPGSHISCSLGIDFYGTWEFSNIYITFADGTKANFYNSNTVLENAVQGKDDCIAVDMSGARAVVANTPEGDTAAPTVEEGTFSASKTNISIGETASMFVSISDTNGVADAQVTVIRGKGGSCGSSFVLDASGGKWSTWVDGQFAGLYEIQLITVTDYCGNKKTYYNNKCSTYNNEPNAMDMSGANVMVSGGDENDTEVPKIDVNSFHVDKQMIGLNENYTLTFKVTDNVAVNSVQTSIKEGKGYLCGCATWYDATTQTATVNLTGYFYGVWEIQFILATDVNGNTAYFYNTAYEEYDESTANQMTQKGDASAANVYVGLSDNDTKTFISGDGMDNDVSLEITEEEPVGTEYEKLIEEGYFGQHYYHLNGRGTYFGNGHRCWVWFWLPLSLDGQWYRIRHLLSDGSIQTENVQAYGHWIKIYVWEFSPFLIESTNDPTKFADSSVTEENTDVAPISEISTHISPSQSGMIASASLISEVGISQPVNNASVFATINEDQGISSERVKTSDNGTAKVLSVKSDEKTVVIGSVIEADGVAYKVKTLGEGALKKCKEVVALTLPSSLTKIEKGAFTGAKNLKTIRLNVKKSITVQKGAFKGVNTKKMTIKVSKKMSDKQYTKFQKTLKKAGYDGKVARSLK